MNKMLFSKIILTAAISVLPAVSTFAANVEFNNYSIIKELNADSPVERTYDLNKSYGGTVVKGDRPTDSLIESGKFSLTRTKLVDFELKKTTNKGGISYSKLINNTHGVETYLIDSTLAVLPYGDFRLNTYLLSKNPDEKFNYKVRIKALDIPDVFELPCETIDQALPIATELPVTNVFYTGFSEKTAHFYQFQVVDTKIISITGKSAIGLGEVNLNILDEEGTELIDSIELNEETTNKYFEIDPGIYYIRVTPENTKGAIYKFILN